MNKQAEKAVRLLTTSAVSFVTKRVIQRALPDNANVLQRAGGYLGGVVLANYLSVACSDHAVKTINDFIEEISNGEENDQ